MSDFDNNGFETTETVETVENVETIDEGAGTSTEYTDYASSQTKYEEPVNDSKVFAIISLVCGIVSLVCSCCGWLSIILAVAAIVLGIISINKQENAKGMAIAGIICGGVGLVIAVVLLIVGAAMGEAINANPDSVEDLIDRLENL